MPEKTTKKVGRPAKVDNVLPPKERAVCERFGAVLKVLKLSQQKAAEKMGLKQNTLSRILTFRNSPSLALLLKIIEAFNVAPDFLLRGQGQMFTEQEKSMNETEAARLSKNIQGLAEQLYTLLK